jgi:starch phosphorylase
MSEKPIPGIKGGKEIIKRIFHIKEVLKKEIKIVYLENSDMELANLMVSGVDLWLNTPQQPMEASGTSGMKAAMNGIPSLSILDGWWLEGHIEGVSGWAIGAYINENGGGGEWANDAASLYHQLENVIIPTDI